MRFEYEEDLYEMLVDHGFDDVGEDDHDRLVYETEDGDRRAEAWIDGSYTVLSIDTDDDNKEVYSVLDENIEYVDLDKLLSDDPELEIQDIETEWEDEYGVPTATSPKK